MSTDHIAAGTQGEPQGGIDVRGPRVGAGITAVLLIAVIALTSLSSVWPSLILLVIVTIGFAVGARGGPQSTWQGAVFRKYIAPRLGPVGEREDPRPPTFAQLVGFIISAIGVIGGALAISGVWAGGATVLLVAAIFALIAAFLNSVFGLCLGCELYLLGKRLRAGNIKA